MYRPKDRKTIPMVPELFPLGGGLSSENRWLKLAGLVPLERLEEVYRRSFSRAWGGRPRIAGRFAGSDSETCGEAFRRARGA